MALLAVLTDEVLGCQDWCVNACSELNGNVEHECGDCDSSDPKYLCHPSAEGFGPRPAGLSQANGKRDAESGAEDRGYDEEPLYRDPAPSRARIDAYEYEEPHEPVPGTCEFEMVIDHTEVNRSWLLGYGKPVLIRGATEGWAALSKWRLESMIENYGSAACECSVSG